MTSKLKITYFPLRLLSFLFIILGNSRYAPVGIGAGFYCDDESIKKPYYGDSIHFTLLLFVLLGVDGVIICISEVLLRNSKAGKKPRCRLYLKYYYTGILYVLAIIEVLKLLFSKLRPHFLESCVPDMSTIECSDGFITSFNCTGEGPRWLVDRDIYKSFPSGHAALSCYAFIFISIYIYSKVEYCKKTPLCMWWIRCIPTSSLIWAVICCISRVLDYRHFWWDVLIGLIIGVIGGLITVKMTLKRASQIPVEKTST